MAVQAGFTAASFLVKALELDKKLKEFVGVERKIEKLKEFLAFIDAVIQNVEACSVTDDGVKELLRNLKHLAYDLEDAVDYYDTEALRKQRSRAYFRPVRDFFSSNNNQLVFMCRMSGMIKAVTENINSILLQKSIHEILPKGTVQMPPPTAYNRQIHPHSFVVIGRETEKEKIVNMLTDDEGSSNDTILKVITIVGMGGLGKTTLARHVFDDERVKAHFGKLYWKIVGAEFDPTKIMKSVLELATGAPVIISEPELVREQLKIALSGKRFLLGLDDVWNEDQSEWGELEAALRCGASGSKVLVTTRSRKVSSIMRSVKTHQIQQLSREDCLSLFRQFAFGDEEPNENLMEIGGKIVEKCGGVPLAAKSLGSMLHSTRDETYWSSVLNSEVWQLSDVDQKLFAVLKLSYDALSPSSKKCFAFGSLFPKNRVMKRDKLIQLWTVYGLVCSEGNLDAETVGNHIFDDLVLRSFFLLAPSKMCKCEECWDDDSHVTKCTMHDLMHDLARSVSEGEYCNIEDYKANKDIQKRTYHLSIDNGERLSNDISQEEFKKSWCSRTLPLIYCGSYQEIFEKSLCLRTLQLIRPPRSYLKISCKQLQLIFSGLKFLRVLDLQYNGISEVPRSVGNLIHLRYLDLSDNEIKVLPDTITLLQNLQYLNLQGNHHLQELPKKLRNMQSLQYLSYESRQLTHMPPGLSQLTSLRSLSCFVVGNKTGSCSITELEDLKLHGEMKIRFFGNYENYSCGGKKVLKNKDFNELSLFFNKSDTYDKSMLDDLCPNMSLKKLKISDYGSQQFPTWLLELQFPNLVELNLEQMTNLEEWPESDGAREVFPLLKRLDVFNGPKLKSMPRFPRIERLALVNCSGSLLSSVGRMTSLSDLSLVNMEGMTSLPTGCLRNLTSLMKLRILSCDELQFLPWDEIQLLTMLHSLTIEDCDNLTSFPLEEVGRLIALRYLCFKCHSSDTLQEFNIQICGKIVNLCGQLQHLHMLRHLRIRSLWIYGSHPFSDGGPYGSVKAQLCICCCDELESLMTATPSTSVLEYLEICDIPNLTTLPGWLQHLRSLRMLFIKNCPQLGSLPKGLRDLHSLQVLFINGCSLQLERRCKSGEDWPNISHVPNIIIHPKDEA